MGVDGALGRELDGSAGCRRDAIACAWDTVGMESSSCFGATFLLEGGLRSSLSMLISSSSLRLRLSGRSFVTGVSSGFRYESPFISRMKVHRSSITRLFVRMSCSWSRTLRRMSRMAFLSALEPSLDFQTWMRTTMAMNSAGDTFFTSAILNAWPLLSLASIRKISIV